MSLRNDIYFFCDDARRRLDRKTIAAYRADLGRFAEWAEDGLRDYLKPTRSELSAYLADLREKRFKQTTISRFIGSIKSLYRFLRAKRRADGAAVELLDPNAVWDRPPQALTLETVQQILAAPQPMERFGLRDKALLEVLYASGATATEIVALSIADLDSDLACVTIGKEKRAVTLPLCAARALRAYLDRQRESLVAVGCDAVFVSRAGRRLTREMVWNLVKKYAKRVGGKVNPRLLRSSFAAHLLEEGATVTAVQELMGHERPRTTKLYARAAVET